MRSIQSLELLEQQGLGVTVKAIQAKKFGGKGTSPSYWDINAWSLCAGESLQASTGGWQLFCWREFKINKFFTIRPARMEFLSRSPDIVLIHNALSSTEIVGVSGTDSNRLLSQRMEQLTGLRSSATNMQIDTQLPGSEVELDSDDRFATVLLNVKHKNLRKTEPVFPS